MQLSSAAYARAIKSDAPFAELVQALHDSPAHSKRILEELARHRDPIIRAWVPEVAREVLGKAAVPIILHLAKQDHDIDVRDVAIEELLEVDLQAAEGLAPIFRKKLQSTDPFEPRTAMWALAAIGDKTSVELISERIAGRDPEALDRITGEVVIMLLTNPAQVLQRLREHDHDRTPWFAKAARILATPEAVQALETCAASAPDPGCRERCLEALGRLRARRPT